MIDQGLFFPIFIGRRCGTGLCKTYRQWQFDRMVAAIDRCFDDRHKKRLELHLMLLSQLSCEEIEGLLDKTILYGRPKEWARTHIKCRAIWMLWLRKCPQSYERAA